MKSFFSPDSIPMKALTLFCDLWFLNMAFIFCSLPIFTIGASATALYSIIFKRLRGEEISVFKMFFAEFRANFKQSTLFWIPYMLICLFLAADVYISHNILPDEFRFLQYPTSIALFVIVFCSVLVFPQMALFNSKTGQIIKNSAILSIVNFPVTFMVIILHIFILLLSGLSPKARVMTLSLLFFFGFAALAYFCSIFYRRIFLKALKKESSSENGENPDEDDEEPLI